MDVNSSSVCLENEVKDSVSNERLANLFAFHKASCLVLQMHSDCTKLLFRAIKINFRHFWSRKKDETNIVLVIQHFVKVLYIPAQEL